jgi:hypothetical protein
MKATYDKFRAAITTTIYYDSELEVEDILEQMKLALEHSEIDQAEFDKLVEYSKKARR